VRRLALCRTPRRLRRGIR